MAMTSHRWARAAAAFVAAAAMLGFAPVTAHADVPTHAYDEQTATAQTVAGTTYYVSTSGKDDAAGTSEDAPTTLAKVNATTFKPGDKILFKAGDTWEATGDAKLDYDNPTALLHPLGSGSVDSKIVLGSYGSQNGSRPILKGNAKVNDTVQLKDQEQWDISGLDVSNTAAGFTGNDEGGAVDDKNGALVKDLRGIHIYGQTVAELAGFHLHDLYVHDVTGEVSWITQNDRSKPFDWGRANMEQQTNGTNQRGGWDFSKRTGGILMEAFKPTQALADADTPTRFSDVLVEDNDLRQNSFGAFTIKQWYGGEYGKQWAEWDGRAPDYASQARMHRNVTIRNNYIDQKGVYNGDGIYLTSTQGALIEGNVVGFAGVCGIEMYFADNVTVQHNEVFEAVPKAGGADSNAIDPDRNSTNIVIQYNYVHDNGDGILICGFDYNTVIIRYNVLFNNRAKLLHDYANGGTIDVYNNVFYQGADIQPAQNAWDTPSWATIWEGGDVWNIKNNVFYYEPNLVGNTMGGHVMSAVANVNYDHNTYYGFEPASNDANATVLAAGEPLFQGKLVAQPYPTSVAERVSVFDMLKLANAKVADTGVPYQWNASLIEPSKHFALGDALTRDYAGNAIDASHPDPGILETTFSGVGGTVSDAYGRKTAGATVTFAGTGAGAQSYKATTSSNGYYAIAGITPGAYAVTVTSAKGTELYAGSATVTDAYTTVDLTVDAASGSLSGTVTDASGKPVAGASVALNVGAAKDLITVTDASGAYRFADAPASGANPFSLKVTADGYAATTVTGVTVRSEQETVVGAIVLPPASSAIEFEKMSATTSDGTTTKSEIESSYSGGYWQRVTFAGVDAWADFTFDVPTEGDYQMTFTTKNASNRVKNLWVQLDGDYVGYAYNLNAQNAAKVENNLLTAAQSPRHLTAGKHTLRFIAKDVSAGADAALDVLTLDPVVSAAILDAPRTDTVGEDSITVTPATIVNNDARRTAEYAIAGADATFDVASAAWQDSTTFAGLRADAAYRVYARVKATNGSAASAPVASDVIRTLTHDATAPVIAGASDRTLEYGAADFDPLAGVTATDDRDGAVPVQTSIAFDGKSVDAVDTTKPGAYAVTYVAVDAAGNRAELTVTVTVKDKPAMPDPQPNPNPGPQQPNPMPVQPGDGNGSGNDSDAAGDNAAVSNGDQQSQNNQQGQNTGDVTGPVVLSRTGASVAALAGAAVLLLAAGAAFVFAHARSRRMR